MIDDQLSQMKWKRAITDEHESGCRVRQLNQFLPIIHISHTRLGGISRPNRPRFKLWIYWRAYTANEF